MIDAVRLAGVLPYLGGIEFARDIVREMDVDRAIRADASLARFVEALRDVFRAWWP